MSLHAPPRIGPGALLCHVDELDDPGSRAFTLVFEDGHALDIFLVHARGLFRAYVNDCPHQRLPLNWQTDRFLTHDRQRILCVMHAATFAIETGEALSGPMPLSCALTPVPIRRDGRRILLAREGLPRHAG